MKKLYTKLVSRGITCDTGEFSAKKIRLTNLSLLLAFVTIFPYTIISFFSNHFYTATITGVYCISAFFIALFRHKVKTKTPIVLIIVIASVGVALIAVRMPKDIGLESFLIVILLFAFSNFESTKDILLASFLIFVTYLFVLLSLKYNFFPPLPELQLYAESVYWTGKFFVFFSMFLLFWSFIVDYKQMYVLLEQNNNLLEKEKIILTEENKRKKNRVVLGDIIESSLDSTISLEAFLQKSLERILTISWLSTKTQGAIFVKNKDGFLKMVAQKNIRDHQAENCSVVKAKQGVCKQTVKQKKSFIGDFCSEFEKNDTNTPYTHRKIPIVLGNKTLGILNLYFDRELKDHEENVVFFKQLCATLATIIQTKQLQSTLEGEKRRQEVLNQKLFAQNLAVKQQNLLLNEQKEELVVVQEILTNEKKEQEILNQKLFAQRLSADQQNIELNEQREELIAVQETLTNEKKEQKILNQKLFTQSLEVEERNRELNEQREELIAVQEILNDEKTEQEILNQKLFAQSLEVEQRNNELNEQKEKLIAVQEILNDEKTEQEILNQKLFAQSLEVEQRNRELNEQKEKLITVQEILNDEKTEQEILNQKLFAQRLAADQQNMEIKEINEKLNKKELHSRIAEEAGKIGTWEWNVQQNKLIWSDMAYKIFNLDKTKKIITADDYFSFVLPEDKKRLLDELDSALKTNQAEFKTEYRILENDKIRWIGEKSKIILDADNKLLKMIGVFQDITRRKRRDFVLRERKQKIETSHKKITDSINYAKTIQDSLLTQKVIIKSYFDDYFILFEPRDGVSGDFYYANKIGNHIIFTVADCTGHGVPGAFLTILGITYLHEVIALHEVNNPSKVLNLLRNKIKDTFKATNNQNGLDIALCAINTETNILQYSGANNPLWIIRNKKLIRYKATRNPIGFYPKETDFENHTIQLENNDKIYLFSDGYQDQFGGDEDKKFTNKRFRELIMSIHHFPMEEQNTILSDKLTKWKGLRSQIDDITVMGIKYQC